MTSSRPLFSQRAQALSQDGERAGEVSPPARLKQLQFALNRKHAFFDAMY